MAQKLSIQLKLEGGDEIKRQLAEMDEAGKKTFNSLAREAKKVGGFQNLDFDTISKKADQFGVKGPEAIKKLNDAVKAAGKFEQIVDGLKLVETALNRTGIAGKALVFALGPLGATVTILSVLFGVALVAGLIKAGQAISAIDAQAIKLGSTFEQFSKVREGLLRAGIVPDSIGQGLEHLQSQIDKLSFTRVEKALTEAQKNIAAGWPPQTAQLEIMRDAANSTSPALAEVGRKALEAIGQPIRDNVTPLLDAMIRSAGGAAKAIPNLTGELQGMTDAGERARLVTGLMDAIKIESGDAVKATLPLLQLLEKMPAGLERNKAATDAFGSAMGTQVAQLLNVGTSISDIIEKSKGMAQSQADDATRIVAGYERMKSSLTGFDQAWGQIATSGTAALGQINSGMDTLIGKLGEAVRLMGQLSAGGGGAPSAPGLAGGGVMGGRGSGTSDSNLAWLSRGEHIMPARAVRQPGVLALLEALRRSGGNLRGVLDRMGHFAMGGLVGAPAFAGGGVNGMNHVTIQFPGLNPIGGLRASSAVVDELRRAAALAQVRSGGRKPSRYS